VEGSAVDEGEVTSRSAPAWWRWYLAALFAGALAWRLAALWRLAHGPLLGMIRDDSQAYWEWASEIRAGGWLPTRPFFLGPLYPYALALLRTVIGDQAIPVFVTQCLLGSLSVTLLADASRRIASPVAAAIVGVFLAGYAMSVFFENMILAEGLQFMLGSLALWLTVRSQARPAWLTGTLVALMSLGRPTFILLLIPLSLLILRTHRGTRVRSIAALATAPLLVILVTGFHHQRTIGAFIPLTYSGGYNLFVGNGPQASGAFQSFTGGYAPATGDARYDALAVWDGRAYLEHATGQRLGPAESSRYWQRLAFERVQSDPAGATRLFLGKVALLFNRREIPQIVDAGLYDRAAGPLGWPLRLEFAVFAILGLAALPAARSRGAEARATIGWLVALTLGTAIFFVVDRYRIHLVPPLAVLSAIGIAELAAWKTLKGSRRIATGAIAACAAALTFAPLYASTPAIDEWNDASTLGGAWLSSGDAAKALPWLERAQSIDESGALTDTSSAAVRLARASGYEKLGLAHAQLGHDAQALAAFATAARLAPESGPLRARYAEQLAICGELEQAIAEYRAAGVPGRDAAQVLLQEAARQDHLGHATTTRNCLEAALALDPGNEPAAVALVRSHIVAGELDAARSLLRDGVAAGLDANVARAHQAWISLAAGDTAAARKLVAAIPESVRVNDPRVAGTLALAARGR
jgi:tetratricopeptide (TPR) repeat protein